MPLFNVRVYGILLDPEKGLLVSDEFIRGNYITKLPGGGLEIGEGTRDGLAREFMEEANIVVLVGDHFYTTDFFQISAFNNKDQIISIYYLVYTADTSIIQTKEKAFDFLPGEIKKLQESFAAEDPAMLKEVAHNMKSTLRILGVAEDISGKVILIEKGDLSITAEKEKMKHLIDEIDNSVQVVLQELREYLAAA